MFKIFKDNLIAIIGWISALGTIITIIFPDAIKLFIAGHNQGYAIALLVISLIIAFMQSLPKDNISCKITNTTDITILYGDIFKTDGIIVIPVNEYFDTIVDKEIVSTNTLHGKLINEIFKNDKSNLQYQLHNGLKGIQSITDTSRERGNKARYPLGTVVKIEKDNIIYYLVALTRFNQTQQAEITKDEYQIVIIGLLNYIEKFAQGSVVNMPLIGSGEAGVDLPKQKILEFLLISMELMDKFTVSKGINIILYKTSKNHINLNRVENIYNTINN
ncbi:MAG: hypothetical protein DRG78_13945 [Epsilonproteobacteria bacterium]|nr:MAG: hypothetical protein DRG78_13945 [Campylobacterota bacterium]